MNLDIEWELLYFAIANMFVGAMVVGAVWTVVGVIPPDGKRTYTQRLKNNALGHAELFIAMPLLLLISYVIYLQFFPDTYECYLKDGSVFETSLDRDDMWIDVHGKMIPTSNITECRPLVTTLSDRWDRALSIPDKD